MSNEVTIEPNREAFIPYSRQEIIELCLADGIADSDYALRTPADRQNFRDFCNILIAYYHFKLHHSLEDLKSNFVPFNPDIEDYRKIDPLDNFDALEKKEADLVNTFETILEQANYFPLSESNLQTALTKDSVFDLKTEVDFNDFDRLVCYCRGEH